MGVLAVTARVAINKGNRLCVRRPLKEYLDQFKCDGAAHATAAANRRGVWVPGRRAAVPGVFAMATGVATSLRRNALFG